MKQLTDSLKGALRIMPLLVLPTLIGACQAAPEQQGNAPMETLQGVLVLKGNLPHTTPVLQTDGSNWELIGLDAEQIKQWQRHRIRVSGRVLPSDPPQRPQLQVEKIEPLPER